MSPCRSRGTKSRPDCIGFRAVHRVAVMTASGVTLGAVAVRCLHGGQTTIRVAFILRTPPDEGREYVLRMDPGMLATEGDGLTILTVDHLGPSPLCTSPPVSGTLRVRWFANSGLASGWLVVLGHGQHLLHASRRRVPVAVSLPECRCQRARARRIVHGIMCPSPARDGPGSLGSVAGGNS